MFAIGCAVKCKCHHHSFLNFLHFVVQEKKATSKKPPCDTHGGSFLGDLEKFSEIWKDVNTCVPVVTSRSDDSKPSKRQISESKRYLSVEKKIEIATAQQKCIENSLRNTVCNSY